MLWRELGRGLAESGELRKEDKNNFAECRNHSCHPDAIVLGSVFAQSCEAGYMLKLSVIDQELGLAIESFRIKENTIPLTQPPHVGKTIAMDVSV